MRGMQPTSVWRTTNGAVRFVEKRSDNFKILTKKLNRRNLEVRQLGFGITFEGATLRRLLPRLSLPGYPSQFRTRAAARSLVSKWRMSYCVPSSSIGSSSPR
jgi:hypothetical protein